MDSQADGDLLVAAIEAFERLLNDQTAGRKALEPVEKHRKNELSVEIYASAGMPPRRRELATRLVESCGIKTFAKTD